jgi:hypothetical protein
MNSNIIFKYNMIDKRLQNLENDVKDINKKCDIILELLKDNSIDCKKMSSHIDFIDNVYENVRAPLNFVCNSINNNNLLSDK